MDVQRIIYTESDIEIYLATLPRFILMMSKDARALLKISDFGLSKKFSSTSMLETYAGTPVRYFFGSFIPNIYTFANSELYGA